MPVLINGPARIAAQGTREKIIDEYFGRVNSGHEGISIAHMRSPSGWEEPGQRPLFDEYTVVLRGTLHVTDGQSTVTVGAGQAVLVKRGEWVRYSTPEAEGAEYLAVCLPAFSPETVRRDPA